VGITPIEKKFPGGYFHRTKTALGQRLEHPMVARVSLTGFVTHEVALTEGPMDWIDLHGRHHGQYWLFKSDHFHVDLENVASKFTGGVPATPAVQPALARFYPRATPGSTETAKAGTNAPEVEGAPMESASSEAAYAETSSQDGFGYLTITSDMDSAEIYVDTKFHGNAPATLKLPAGTHTVVVKSLGVPDYVRVIDIPRSSKLTLKALFLATSAQ
jgi:PEGA domain